MNTTINRALPAARIQKTARFLATGTAAVALGSAMAIGAPAQAATTAGTDSNAVGATSGLTTAVQGRLAIKIAATKKGTPYRYGATGPRAFDCSGYTRWVYARLGKSIPRTANAQYRASYKISRAKARPGDLVFFGSGRKYHVGIYAGGNKMWHSPRSGKTVTLAKIWSSRVSFGRVR